MGKTVMAALLVFAALAAATGTASAQGGETALPEGSAARREEGSLYRGAYEVTEDGALIYGGDVVYRCEDLVGFGAPAKPGSEDVTVGGAVVEPLTREAVALCAKAGFPPEGAVLGGASATPSASDSAGGPDAERDDALPETGGPDPQALMLAAAASLAVGAALARRARR